MLGEAICRLKAFSIRTFRPIYFTLEDCSTRCILQRDATLDHRCSGERSKATSARTAIFPVLDVDMKDQRVGSYTDVARTPYVGEEPTLRKLLDQVFEHSHGKSGRDTVDSFRR